MASVTRPVGCSPTLRSRASNLSVYRELSKSMDLFASLYRCRQRELEVLSRCGYTGVCINIHVVSLDLARFIAIVSGRRKLRLLLGWRLFRYYILLHSRGYVHIAFRAAKQRFLTTHFSGGHDVSYSYSIFLCSISVPKGEQRSSHA